MQFSTARIREAAGALGRSLGDLIFPPSCAACGASGAATDRDVQPPFCEACQAELPLLLGSMCRRCASPTVVEQPTGKEPGEGCGHCRDRRLRFDEAIAAGAYEGLLRDLVLRGKRVTEDAIVVALGKLIWRQASARLEAIAPDVVTCVPMHWSRRWRRQANSPELMASVLADRLRVPLAAHLLQRGRRTAPQADLPKSARAKNVRRAFRVSRGYELNDATVLLVDDILTTGATGSEAAAELKRSGARRVVLVVAARTI